MRPRRPTLWGCVLAVFILAGAGTIGLGITEIVTTQRFLADAATANGAVVKVDKVVTDKWDSKHDTYERETLYYPVVRFVTASGQVVQYRDNNGQNPPAARLGESVRVFYDPANPQHARLDTWWISWWFGDMVLIIAGVFFLLIGVVAMLLSRTSRSKRQSRGAQTPVRGRRPPRSTPPRSDPEPHRPPHRAPADDRPQDSNVQDV